MNEFAPDLVLSVEDLRTHFESEVGVVRSVDGVSVSLAPREVVDLIGKSGFGKTRVGRTMRCITEPSRQLSPISRRGRRFSRHRDRYR